MSADDLAQRRAQMSDLQMTLRIARDEAAGARLQLDSFLIELADACRAHLRAGHMLPGQVTAPLEMVEVYRAKLRQRLAQADQVAQQVAALGSSLERRERGL